MAKRTSSGSLARNSGKSWNSRILMGNSVILFHLPVIEQAAVRQWGNFIIQNVVRNRLHVRFTCVFIGLSLMEEMPSRLS